LKKKNSKKQQKTQKYVFDVFEALFSKNLKLKKEKKKHLIF